MSHRGEKFLTVRMIARLLAQMIKQLAAKKGTVLPRPFDSLRKALALGDGFAKIVSGVVVAYAECNTTALYFIIRSVSVRQGYEGGGYGGEMLLNRIVECTRRDPNKPIILSCATSHIGWYAKFGFEVQPKECAPICVCGGRDYKKWMSADRVWMMRKPSSDQKKEDSHDSNTMCK